MAGSWGLGSPHPLLGLGAIATVLRRASPITSPIPASFAYAGLDRFAGVVNAL